MSAPPTNARKLFLFVFFFPVQIEGSFCVKLINFQIVAVDVEFFWLSYGDIFVSVATQGVDSTFSLFFKNLFLFSFEKNNWTFIQYFDLTNPKKSAQRLPNRKASMWAKWTDLNVINNTREKKLQNAFLGQLNNQFSGFIITFPSWTFRNSNCQHQNRPSEPSFNFAMVWFCQWAVCSFLCHFLPLLFRFFFSFF